jgi:sulfur carrier protein ThiS
MTTASFRFQGGISAFHARQNRASLVAYRCARGANLKNAIEALGVPHTEIGALTVNGQAATLQRTVRDGDAVEVFPPSAEMGSVPIFVADAHLGGLARFLRMLGFDTLHALCHRGAGAAVHALPQVQPAAAARGALRGGSPPARKSAAGTAVFLSLRRLRPGVLARLALPAHAPGAGPGRLAG